MANAQHDTWKQLTEVESELRQRPVAPTQRRRGRPAIGTPRVSTSAPLTQGERKLLLQLQAIFNIAVPAIPQWMIFDAALYHLERQFQVVLGEPWSLPVSVQRWADITSLLQMEGVPDTPFRYDWREYYDLESRVASGAGDQTSRKTGRTQRFLVRHKVVLRLPLPARARLTRLVRLLQSRLTYVGQGQVMGLSLYYFQQLIEKWDSVSDDHDKTQRSVFQLLQVAENTKPS